MTATELLRVVASRESLDVLSALATSPEYPRRLAARLRRREQHVSQRLRILEEAGLVHGSWAREDGKNVRLYRLKAGSFIVSIGPRGYQIQTPTGEVDPEASVLEQAPSRSAIFGRERELATLANPASRFSMVVGLAGMGKTTLAAELAHRHGVERVFWHTFMRFDSVTRILGLFQSWLGSLDSSARQKFGRANWDIGELFDKVTEGLSQERALIVLDDYQEVRDDAIHEVVRRWQRILKDAKLVVLSRTRPPFDVELNTRLIMLSGLDPSSSRALLRGCGIEPSRDELREVNRLFGGHPLSLRLYAQQPDVIHGAGGGPVENVGHEAFRSLDRESQQVLLVLAVVRRPLTTEEIQLLAGVRDANLLLVLLHRRALIRRVEDRYAVHDVIRESLAEFTRSGVEIHRKALEMYLSSPGPESKLEALHHAAQIGEPAAIGALLEADMLEDPDPLLNRGYVDVYDEILSELPINRLSLRHQALVHFGRADVLHLKARWEAADREFEIAEALANRANDPRILVQILRRWGDNRTMGGRVKAGLEAFDRALRIAERLEWSSQKADIFLEFHGVFNWFLGDSQKAREYSRRALDEARRTDNRSLIRELNLYPATWPQDWRRVVTRLRGQIRALKPLGQPRQMAGAHFRLGEISCRYSRLTRTGKVAFATDALRHLRRAITGLEALGSTKFALVARSWYAFAFLQAERIPEAENEAEALLSLEREIGRQPAGVLARRVLSAVWQSRGDIARARAFAKAAVNSARRSHPQELGIALLEQALLEKQRLDPSVVRRMIRKAVQEISRHGYPDEVRFARRQARATGVEHW